MINTFIFKYIYVVLFYLIYLNINTTKFIYFYLLFK